MQRKLIVLIVILAILIAGILFWYRFEIRLAVTTHSQVSVNNATAIHSPSDPAPSQAIPVAEDRSALDFAITGNVSLIITDAVGQRTGRDAISQNISEEIPGSSYFEDSLSPDEVDRSIEISRPQEGRYQICITSLRTGPYQLSIRAFSRDGSPQPELLKRMTLAQGSQYNLVLEFKNMPGATSFLDPE